MAKKKSSKKTKTKAKAKANKALKTKGASRGVKAKAKRPAAKPKARVAKRPAAAAKKPAPVSAPAPAASAKELPDLELQATSGPIRLGSLKGKNVVLYFYPKDDTPGCTAEGCDLRDNYGQFQTLDTVVLGVSRDSVESHGKFKAKYNFPFELLSDPDEKLCRAFGVIREKTNYGKTYMGVDRSTFIFDKTGALRKEFRGVSVPGHVDQILEEVRRL